METTHSRVDLAACARNGQEPAAIITREPRDAWLVSYDAIRMDQPIQWRPTSQEQHVYIPLVPYLMQPDFDLALAYMLQLGMRVSFDLGRPVRRLHIVTGVPVNEISDAQSGTLWQYYAGFGVVLE